ncbi:hypothetical protein [Streptomyces sp. NRRL S-1813]|uniref:hypothetical protein n=1 Tax=Streptomyces sp. NRRL S-1813 TaxID=1463888 RepID=UPI0004CABE5F|nr:hypothetical protein [Streptomyces sp. NRRL S-1813]
MAKRCDGHDELMRICQIDAVWQVKRRDRVFTWFYACGDHLDQLCNEEEGMTGQRLEVVRLGA